MEDGPTYRREALEGYRGAVDGPPVPRLDIRKVGGVAERSTRAFRQQGNRGLAQKLVEAGATIGEALHAAAGAGHGDVATDLLDNRASINARDITFARTPLHCAAEEGRIDMINLLMLTGADEDALAENGWTPLHVAVLPSGVATRLPL